MKKLCYAVFLILFLSACAMPFLRADKAVAFEDMKKTGESLVSTKDFKAGDESYIRQQYELNKSDYDAILCYGVPSAMEVNEFTIVEAKEKAKRTHIMEQLQSRVDRQYKSFSGYAPRQAELLKKAVLYERGDYVILIVHDKAETMKDSINELF